MVSDKNIKRILGKDILIYPLIPENVEGASIFLTASNLAWSLKSKKISISDDTITVPTNDSIVIITNESIALNLKYAGICFPRVPNTTHGLISATTYVKPGWIGKLAIVIFNPTDHEQKIKINDQICVLSLDRLESSSTKKDIERKGSQFTTQMLTDFGVCMSLEEKSKISNNMFNDFENMKSELIESDTYKKFVKRNKKIWNDPINILISISTVFLVALLGFIGYNLINKHEIHQVVTTLFSSIFGFLGGLVAIKVKER